MSEKVKKSMKELLGVEASVVELLKCDQLPASTGIHIARMARSVAAECQTFRERQRAAIEKHGGPPGKMGEITVKPDNQPKFREEVDALLDTEVEVEFPKKVTLPGNIKIAPKVLFDLIDDFIIVPEPKETPQKK